jgi:cytochrome c-type biogenesis protein CcmH
MNRRFALCLLLTAVAAMVPALAGGDPRIDKLFGGFMAPCCWQGNLLDHNSPKAEQLRTGIRRMVAEGRTDDEIKSALVAEYSARILVVPEGASWQWLWWTPWAAAAAGLAALAAVIARLRRAPAAVPTTAPPPDASLDLDDFD